MANPANRLGPGAQFLSSAAAPTPAGTDRIWVKSSNDHLIFTNQSNVDTDLSAAVGGGAAWTRTAVADTSPTISPTTSSYILAAYTSITAARTVTGTTAGAAGTPVYVEIVDESRAASSTNTITFTPSSGTIDGVASKIVIGTPGGSWKGYCDGTNWHTALPTSTMQWTAITPGTGWSNQAGYPVFGWTKDAAGVVWLRGYVSGSGAGTAVGTLPAGARPGGKSFFGSYDGTSTWGITIDSTGAITCTSASGGLLGAQIQFPAEN